LVTAQVGLINSGELVFCPGCNKNKPNQDFLDPSLQSGIGRKCMTCKGKSVKGKTRRRTKSKKRTSSTGVKNIWTGKSCRVCARHIVEGENWAPSRVKRHDYICSSCHGKSKKRSPSKNSSRKLVSTASKDMISSGENNFIYADSRGNVSFKHVRVTTLRDDRFNGIDININEGRTYLYKRVLRVLSEKEIRDYSNEELQSIVDTFKDT